MKWFRRSKSAESQPTNIDADDLRKMLKFGKACDTISNLKSRAFIELPYGIVKLEVPKHLQSGDIESAVLAVMQHQYPEFKTEEATGNEVIAFVLWMKTQLEHIANIEKRFLASDPEPEMLAAGLMRLNEFGDMATVDQLAKGDILKYPEIKALPYFEIYQKLKLDKTQRDIEKQYNKIMADKAKRK